MTDKSKDPQIAAIEAIYTALKVLEPAGRRRVLASVAALLDVEGGTALGTIQSDGSAARQSGRQAVGRPMSLVELVQEKRPGTNSQRIATYAYFREKHEGLPRFNREDLETYFAKAKEPPAGNYDRDFVEAVKKGWIHEDGAESYLTSKGLEAVEAGFEGEIKRSRGAKGSARRKPGQRKRKAKGVR